MTVPANHSRYDLYDLVRLGATFVSTDLVTTLDPSQILLLTRNPLGTVATYLYGAGGASIARLATGAYAKDLSVEVPGQWAYRWQATGVGQSAAEWTFYVVDSGIF